MHEARECVNRCVDGGRVCGQGAVDIKVWTGAWTGGSDNRVWIGGRE